MNSSVRHRFNLPFGCGLFLTALLLVSSLLRAQTGTERAGLGVFGPVLGIHGEDTLVVNGNVVLDRATVVGMGTLSLRSDKPQRIITHQSKVQSLHLAAVEGITLYGELTIEKALTIDGTTLDTRGAALTLGDSARLWLRHGGQLKRGTSLLTARPEPTKAPAPTESPLEGTPIDLTHKLLVSQSEHKIRFGTVFLNWSFRPVDEPSPPPEA